jgi:hypothetical protein
VPAPLESVILNQLFKAIRDVEVVVFVDIPDVTATEPAIIIDGVSSRLGVFLVAFEDIRTFDPDLTFLARWSFVLAVHDLHGYRREILPTEPIGLFQPAQL